MTPFVQPDQPQPAPYSQPPQPNPQTIEARRQAQQELLKLLDANTAVAGGGPVTRIINGVEIKFPELSFYDRRDLVREWRKTLRAEKQANLQLAGISGEQAYVELSNFDEATRRGGENLWVQFFESDDGKLNILTWSLRKDPALNGWPADKNLAEAEVMRVVQAVASKWPEVSRLCAVLTNTPIFADTLKAPPPLPSGGQQTDPTVPPEGTGAQTAQTAQTTTGSAGPEQGTPTPPKGFGTL